MKERSAGLVHTWKKSGAVEGNYESEGEFEMTSDLLNRR